MSEGVAVHAERLTRRFRTGGGGVITALEDVDLDLPAGALIVVRGPSGCGKSTLLNLIGALDRADEGGLRVMGVDLGALDHGAAARFRREHVGFLFQDAGLIEPMTVSGNLTTPLVYRETPAGERAPLIEAALDSVNLGSRAGSLVSELSGGERHRIGLARAIVSRPAILICDEPTAALDEQNGVEIADLLIRTARAGAAVICSSHDPMLIKRADVVVQLRHGRTQSLAL